MIRLLVALALLGAGSARANDPEAYSSPEGARQFSLCRAAVFYHLDDRTRGTSTIPLSVTRTMREQIEFLMQETVAGTYPESIADGQRLVRFVESWFIGFTEVLRDERERLLDPARRDAILLDCIAFLWVTMASDIDRLKAWRAKAVAAPPLPSPEDQLRRWDEHLRALTR